MGNYPEKTCTNDRLVKQKKLVDATLAGVKTQQRRDGVRPIRANLFSSRSVRLKWCHSLTNDSGI